MSCFLFKELKVKMSHEMTNTASAAESANPNLAKILQNFKSVEIISLIFFAFNGLALFFF